MPEQKQKGQRVTFESSVAMQIMAIDGTWRRSCPLKEVSDIGATLVIKGSVEGLNLKEFFLLLSATGLAYRRCELSWVNGDRIGVAFVNPADKTSLAWTALFEAASFKNSLNR
jgi:hypothetical protein